LSVHWEGHGRKTVSKCLHSLPASEIWKTQDLSLLSSQLLGSKISYAQVG
jgi:hypothetical protein